MFTRKGFGFGVRHERSKINQMIRIPTPLPRFWMNRRSSDRNAVRLSDESQLSLANGITGRCTVLLAPPGAGKTIELESLVKCVFEKCS